MIQVCYYKGCGVVYGEKEPLSDKRETHGLCPKHLEISLREIKVEMERMHKTGSFRVLIVEDSTLFRQLFKEALRNKFPSVKVDEAIDGGEAIQKVETLRPNLIFMDIRLPGENGLELTRRIKALYPKIIVIILTGYDLPEYREASFPHADYFFSKDSLTTKDIFTLLESILPGRV
jgi:CheY-like chemotaxis protein